MPPVDLREALLEFEEDEATQTQIRALLDYGTDNLDEARRLEREMHEDTLWAIEQEREDDERNAALASLMGGTFQPDWGPGLYDQAMGRLERRPVMPDEWDEQDLAFEYPENR